MVGNTIELQKLVEKRAIKPIKEVTQACFISSMCVVSKADGSWRLESAQHVHLVQASQDGIDKNCEASSGSRRLDGEIGSKRCVPIRPLGLP